MSDYDLLVRDARLVTATDTFRGDIGIRDGRIAAIGRDLGDGRRVVDAGGLPVLPGGVDTHCHLEQVAASGAVSADDFYSGSVAAACGGTTTIVPFASQARGQSLRDAVADYHDRARARAAIDYSFHMIVSDPTPQVLDTELPELIRSGHRSIKIFMCYEHRRFSDRLLLETLSVAARHGAVTLVHAENHDLCEFVTERLLAQGRTRPRDHAYARPVAAEREAVHRILSLAETAGAPVIVAHVTCADVVGEVQRARRCGQPVAAETCPHYLVLDRSALEGSDESAAMMVCSPPYRGRSDQEALWRALACRDLDLVTSDHAPTDARYDPAADFTKLSNGLTGLETRLSVVYSNGVADGRFDINHFVELVATNPAKLFGLYPRKGTIAVGSDADLVVWDETARRSVAAKDLHHGVAHTPFEDMAVTGWPVTTISRGEVVFEKGEPRLERGRGVFLEQAPTSLYRGSASGR